MNRVLLIRLTITMVVTWFMMSGFFKPFFLVLAALSIGLVVYLSNRMQVLQHRGQPIYFRFVHIVGYWLWLGGQIILSNIDVTRRVLMPSLPIKPSLWRVSATPNSEMGRVIYANSITLTPGTTAINFTPDGDILVHALHEDSLHELEAGEMAERIKAVEPRLGHGAEHRR